MDVKSTFLNGEL
jgi:hypothetical protein